MKSGKELGFNPPMTKGAKAPFILPWAEISNETNQLKTSTETYENAKGEKKLVKNIHTGYVFHLEEHNRKNWAFLFLMLVESIELSCCQNTSKSINEREG